MIQEITAQGRNLEEMNVKAEMQHNVLWKKSEEATEEEIVSNSSSIL